MTSMEEYALHFEHIHKLMEQRQNVTTTYLTVNSGNVGGVTWLFSNASMTAWVTQVSTFGLLLVGLLACDFWRCLIIRYSEMLGWWYAQMRAAEEKMLDSSKLITQEYQELYTPSEQQIRPSLSHYEKRLTWLFTAIYIIFIIITIALFIKSNF
jgi:hypothetical protein